MTKVLDLIGAAGEQFKGAEIFSEHVEGQCYDEIVTYLSLSQMQMPEAIETFKKWASWLEPGGVIHLIEPSAEWFAREVLGGRLTVLVEYHLFGNGKYAFRSAWTMTALRDLASMNGLVAAPAITQPYPIGKIGDQEVLAQQHYVVCTKPGGKGVQWSLQ